MLWKRGEVCSKILLLSSPQFYNLILDNFKLPVYNRQQEIYLCFFGPKHTIVARLKISKIVKTFWGDWFYISLSLQWMRPKLQINPITSFQTTHHPTCSLLSYCIHSNSSQLSGVANWAIIYRILNTLCNVYFKSYWYYFPVQSWAIMQRIL